MISKRRRAFHASNHNSNVPGVEPQFLLGNLLQSGALSGKPYFQIFSDYQEKYGDIFKYRFGPHSVVAFNRLDHVQYIFAHRHIYDHAKLASETFSLLTPNGLIALTGAKFKRHARVMLPMFKKSKVVPYLETVNDCTDELLLQKWRADGNEKLQTDIIRQCQDLLLCIITSIAFDYDLKTAESSSPVRLAIKEFVDNFVKILLLSGTPTIFSRLYLKFNWKYQKALVVLRKEADDIIRKERARQEKEQEIENAINTKRRNLISLLVSSLNEDVGGDYKQGLTCEELLDEILLSIVAGFETTSTVLAWFIFHMSKYPAIQEKIKEELKLHNVTKKTSLTNELLDKLEYIDCVLKEVLRFSPIMDGTLRTLVEDDQIDGVQLRKGDSVYIGLNNIHRDKRLWKLDPDQFLPERFLDTDDKNQPIWTFGGGHRACAGQDLARFELKVICTRLMQSLTFLDSGDEQNSGGFLQRITCLPKRLAVYCKFD
ncbi:unnamed protein product [Didymodactylos carnosus]|uniref:Cytochrome P450 n=2 Tax=Didymodactylos carnosus TaxID=1234261 RepID=A0A814WJ31_9BILA|nr:unnamed protein product [Didymodactylos carnosus]